MRAGLSRQRATSIIEEVVAKAIEALENAMKTLPQDFPVAVINMVSEAVNGRLRGLQLKADV